MAWEGEGDDGAFGKMGWERRDVEGKQDQAIAGGVDEELREMQKGERVVL